MPAYYIVGLMLFVLLLAVLLIRYVHITVDSEFKNLARAETDGGYRGEELARMDNVLADLLPIPDDAVGAPGRPSFALRAVGPSLLFLGVALLWGGVFSNKEKSLWLWGGFIACLASGAIMFLTVRRRKWDRLARLLRFRADLRRLDGDHAGAAADLGNLLRLTPWDDAAWAELADDLASVGKLDDSLDAVRQAAVLDPDYEEYRMLECSLALRLGRLDEARAAVENWSGMEKVGVDDPRVAIFKAALDLADGNRDRAADAVRKLMLDDDGTAEDFLDSDAALAGIRKLAHGQD